MVTYSIFLFFDALFVSAVLRWVLVLGCLLLVWGGLTVLPFPLPRSDFSFWAFGFGF